MPPWRHLLFYMLMIDAALAVLFFSWQAYHKGPVVAFVTGLCLSWIPMQLIARVMLGHWLWPWHTQYPSFFFGDIALPVLAAVMAVMCRHTWPVMIPWFFRSGWYTLLTIAAATVIAVQFHRGQAAIYRPDVLTDPTKEFHDLFVYPAFSYFLLGGLPYLLFSDWGIAGLVRAIRAGAGLGVVTPAVALGLALAMLGTWLVLGMKVDRWAESKYVLDPHRRYNWQTGEYSGPLPRDEIWFSPPAGPPGPLTLVKK